MPTRRLVAPIAILLLGACADAATAPRTITPRDPSLQQSAGRGVFQRYVAIGTSLSMGWASDGGIGAAQRMSWPAQLARMGDREITQPYIAAPGCRSPIAPPLIANTRLSGEPILTNLATLSCAPNEPGVTLPTQNVAVNGARVADALYTTPDNVVDPTNAQLYSRILPSGATQVSAMEAQQPKLVSVELGANEVLAAQSGIALVGPPPAPILDPATFAAQYGQVLDRVQASTAKHVLLIGLPTNMLALPSFRTGAEIASQAVPLAVVFNVAVAPDCATTDAANLIFVPFSLAPTIKAGLTAKQLGGGPVPFSCAGGAPTSVDFVLTPQEQAIVGAVVAQMNATITGEAQSRGYAFASLDALFAAADARPPFDVVALMTSAQPFGPLMSLDGVHPNAAGQELIAGAAAMALDQRYNLGITAF